MRFYVEEITVLNDGTSPVAIYEKGSELEAKSYFHQAMASAIINDNVSSIHVEVKNEFGGISDRNTWIRPVSSTQNKEETESDVLLSES